MCPLLSDNHNKGEMRMRNPGRIDDYLAVIEKIWKDNPDLRFSQLVLNVFTNPFDYYKEDEETVQMFKEVYRV